MNNFFKQTVFFLFVLFTCLALGQVSASDIENPKSKSLDNWVSNPDGIISEEAVGTINGKINRLYDSTKAQIAVVIIKGDKMTSARDLSMDLFDSWKVGTKGMDNGLIILVVTESHQCFLRTGYGLEGCLTDALTSRIFSLKMKPYFKENQWEKGIINGLDACIEVMYSDFNENGGSFSRKEEQSLFQTIVHSNLFKLYILAGLILLIVFCVYMSKDTGKIGSLFRTEKYNSLKSNFKTSSLTLLFFGIWFIPLLYIFYKLTARKIRYRSVNCTCGNKMRLLSEKEEDAYLNDREQFEEMIGSRDYDVWLCDKCGRIHVYPYEKNNKYSNCPVCKTKAAKQTSETMLREATHYREGLMRRFYTCKHCGHTFSDDIQTPKLMNTGTPIIIGGGRFSSGGSSFGGFSGGSFGGGMSGGGGGGGSW